MAWLRAFPVLTSGSRRQARRRAPRWVSVLLAPVLAAGTGTAVVPVGTAAVAVASIVRAAPAKAAPATWDAMTTAQFKAYSALIIGDPSSGSTCASSVPSDACRRRGHGVAASMAPDAVSQVVAVSGPGISPAEQERYRIERAVGGDADAMAWVEERTRRVIAGDDLGSMLASQRAYLDRPWYTAACEFYDRPEMLPLLARIFAFDPATVLPDVRCPVFAAFGGADDSVPVPPSIQALTALLAPNSRHALAVYPQADHGICVPGGPGRPLSERLAPGFVATLTAWLSTSQAAPAGRHH